MKNVETAQSRNKPLGMGSRTQKLKIKRKSTNQKTDKEKKEIDDTKGICGRKRGCGCFLGL